MAEFRNMDEVLQTLENTDIISFDLTKIPAMIKVAKNAYADAVKKADLLLKRVADMLGTKLEEISIKGSNRSGFIIEGKLRKYFLEYSQEAAVYDLASERKLCIVEKTGHGSDPTDQVGVDKIVNRMLALKSDNKLVDQIHTLQ